jgi:hypothetical protein
LYQTAISQKWSYLSYIIMLQQAKQLLFPIVPNNCPVCLCQKRRKVAGPTWWDLLNGSRHNSWLESKVLPIAICGLEDSVTKWLERAQPKHELTTVGTVAWCQIASDKCTLSDGPFFLFYFLIFYFLSHLTVRTGAVDLELNIFLNKK